MAWVKLSDDYMDHPKFQSLSDGAFRLWHRGMCWCRKYPTDGLLDFVTVRGFKEYSPKRALTLATPWKAGQNPLWHVIEGVGYRVHDFLDWNPSKEEEAERRAESKSRMQAMRDRRVTRGVAPALRDSLQRNSVQTNAFVLGEGKGIGNGSALVEEKIAARAGALVERYGALFALHRHGARYHARPNVDWLAACDLCRTEPDDERLVKLAEIVLTTDDEWISRTDRSFKIFAMKATWADDRLAQLERNASA